MNKLIYLIFPLLLCFSCNQKDKPAPTISDEISSDNLQTDSLSLIGIGDLKFGMTYKEACELESLKDATKFKKSISFYSKILAETYGCEAYFEKDTLYKIVIENTEFSASNLSVIKRSVFNLVEAFTDKYGEADFTKPTLDASDLRSGTLTSKCQWQIGDKEIRIGIYSLSSKPMFKPQAIITHQKYEKMALQAKEEERLREKETQENPV